MSTAGQQTNNADAHRWYVMLFPSAEEQRAILDRLRQLADAIGGTPNPAPHVTVGYFHGEAANETVTAAFRAIEGPAVTIRASGLFSWSNAPHPLFGYTLSLRVHRTPALQTWQRTVRTALADTGLEPVFTREEQRPHMNVLRGMPMPWTEAVRRVPDQSFPLAWTAARLVLSRQVGKQFVTLLERPLHPAP
jgi:2'-5' RNA ligase